MPLGRGTKLGHYEIEEPLGAGGMGEVYRARDTRLHRTVAIKVLGLDALTDPAGSRRLVQEARAASALNHPNIVTLYDVSSDTGVDFLVMEYVPGKSLKDLLRPEGLPLRDVVTCGIQAASALACAHAAGVVHRDIKPANIIITPQGQVKVLDFGIAKLSQPPDANKETLTQFTAPGTVMGTVSYMSPEQTRGEELDGRSDIFSLGVVLYEAATGRLPFHGDSALAVMHEIATVEPMKPSTTRNLPAEFDRIVARSLAKKRAERFQTASEFLAELARLEPAQQGHRHVPLRRAAYAGLLVAALGLAGWWIAGQHRAAPTAAAPLLQQMTNFAEGAGETGPSSSSSPALSSDGRLLAFIHDSQVWIKLVPTGEPTEITHDQEVKFDPAFSPDGAQIAYSSISLNGSWDTWVVPSLGGEPHLWLPNASGLTWTSPGRVMFSEMKAGEGIHMAVAAANTNREERRYVYVPPEMRGMAHRSYLSPDRKWVLLAEMDRGSWLPCRVVPFDGSSNGRTVGPARGQCTNAGWSPEGRWIYLESNASGEPQIWRQRFPDGAPEQLTFGPSEARGVAVAPDGKSLITGIGFVQHVIVFHDENGERTLTTQGDSIFPAWGDGFPTSVFSPDGLKMYYLLHNGVTRAFGGGELRIYDFSTGSSQAFFPGSSVSSFDISPDGKELAIAALDQESVSRIWLAPADRRAPARRIYSGEGMGPVFGSGGEIYFRGQEGSQWFVFALRPESGVARKLIAEPSVDAPAVTPDRKWVILTVPFQGGSRVKAFQFGGGEPINVCDRCSLKWSRDQRTLFVAFMFANASQHGGETILIPLSVGEAFPKLQEGGLTSANGRTLRGAQVIKALGVFPGIHSTQYTYVKAIVHRNLYRLLLPQ